MFLERDLPQVSDAGEDWLQEVGSVAYKNKGFSLHDWSWHLRPSGLKGLAA